MSRVIYPALALRIRKNDGWIQIIHEVYKIRGWLCYQDAQLCIGFDKTHENNLGGKYEIWLFKKYSFIEDLRGGFPPNISVDESQIISKKEITLDELHNWENKL